MMLPCVAPKQAVAQANCLGILWQTSVRLYPAPLHSPAIPLLQVESQYCGCSCKILNVFAVLCFALQQEQQQRQQPQLFACNLLKIENNQSNVQLTVQPTKARGAWGRRNYLANINTC